MGKSPAHDALCIEAQKYFMEHFLDVTPKRFVSNVDLGEICNGVESGEIGFDGGIESFRNHEIHTPQWERFSCSVVWEMPLFDPPKYKSEPYISAYCDLMFTVTYKL